MKTISLGNKQKKFKSIKEASEHYGISYMTLYMRLRAEKNVKQSLITPVRKYHKKVA